MHKEDFVQLLGNSVKISRVTSFQGIPGERAAWHAHYNRLHLAFIESGRGEYEMRGRIWQLRANSVIMAMPGEFHEFRVDERYPYFAWFIYLDYLADPPDFLSRSMQADKKVFRLLARLADACKTPDNKLMQYGLLLEIFALLKNAEPAAGTAGRAGIEPAWAPVFKALHGPPFNYPGIDALSEMRKVSRRNFTSWFHKVTGQTVKEYYLDKVMTYAEKMLCENMPQKELASRCGYSNVQNFMAAYRAYRSGKGGKKGSGGGFRL